MLLVVETANGFLIRRGTQEIEIPASEERMDMRRLLCRLKGEGRVVFFPLDGGAGCTNRCDEKKDTATA